MAKQFTQRTRTKKGEIPKILHYKSKDLAYIIVGGNKKYLGKFGSPEVEIKRLQVWADHLAGRDSSNRKPIPTVKSSVAVLVQKFLDDARSVYTKHGRQTGTYEQFKIAVDPLLKYFGLTQIQDFGPLALKKLRQKMVDDERVVKYPSGKEIRQKLSRNTVNKRIAMIKQVFAWGVENELVSESIASALRYVRDLRAGQTTAHEMPPVRAVESHAVNAILSFLPPTIDDMVRIHRIIGCRPSEVCNLRWCDTNESDDIWIFTPWEWKTEHKNQERPIPILPEAQQFLEKYRHRPVEEFIFSPRETVRIVAERKQAARKTKVTPSQAKRAKEYSKKPPKHNERYSTRSYERAIDRACDKAGIPRWNPNQLRHAFATEARELFDAETAQLILGHAQLNTTEIYAEKSLKKIKDAARMIANHKSPTN